VNISSSDWYVRYKVPGKYYDSDSNGDKFDVPAEYAPLRNVEESFFGMPGEVRVNLNFHIGN
jgi:hypothetical protein